MTQTDRMLSEEKVLKISVMITTRNRCEELRRTLARLIRLDPLPDEILVTADGCEDNTAAMVREEFPQCLLTVNDAGRGSVPSRDSMLRAATGDVVLSLDDDSYPLEDDFLARLPVFFLSRPEASVMTFPELRDDGGYALDSKSPHCPGHYVSAYPNGAAAMLRRDYLETGGYSGQFFHAYEEPDYALQVYALGKGVWFEPSAIIRHHLSPMNRDDLRTHHFNARNELWSVWMRCPWPWLPVVSLFRLLRQFGYACTQGWEWVRQEPRWWLAALGGWKSCLKQRRPVVWNTYLAWMRLARRPLYTRAEFGDVFGSEKTDDGKQPAVCCL